LRTLADWDPEIQKALTFLPEAQALEDNAHKVLAQKAQARMGPRDLSSESFVRRHVEISRDLLLASDRGVKLSHANRARRSETAADPS